MKPVLALTMGEPGGIGPELALRAWQDLHHHQEFSFALIADPELIARRNQRFGFDVPLAVTDFAHVSRLFAGSLPLIPVGSTSNDQLGSADPHNAAAVIGSIKNGVQAVISGQASAIVTNPIQKSSLYAAGFAFPGHTEFLAALAEEYAGAPFHPVMMLASEALRVVPVTIHIPLADVPAALTSALILTTGRIVAHSLKQLYAIAKPRIAVSGLNPHAGEAGSLGREDAAIIAPAIAQLKAEGIDARGPLPADTMFHAAARAHYDAALCMYHDQALIPAKTLAFESAVNVTLGLPFIRTSPDHGTALDIAERGIADPQSLIAALRLAAKLATQQARVL